MDTATTPVKKFKITLANTLLTIGFVVGMGLTMWAIGLVRDTLIENWVPWVIWLSPGLLLTPFDRQFLLKEYKLNSWFFQALYNISSAGGGLLIIFMAINFYFTSPGTAVRKLPITSYGKMNSGRYNSNSTCKNPYVVFDYKGSSKEFPFPCGTEVEKYKFIQLTVKRGLMGYDVIISEVLVN